MTRTVEILLLLRSAGPMQPGEVAHKLKAPGQSVRATAHKLRKEGLLRSPPDRRRIPLALTVEGEREADRLVAVFAEPIRLLADLSMPAETEAARVIARRLYKALLGVYRPTFVDDLLLGGEVPDWLTEEGAE